MVFLCACAGTNGSTSSSTEDVQTKPHSGDAYTSHADSYKNRKEATAYSSAVNSTYKMNYSDKTSDSFVLDGVLEVENSNDNPTAHITQNIDSNGGNFTTEGYYYDGRLYNTYNSVNYYEDMDLDNLKKTELVPMDPEKFDQDDIDSITAADGSDGSIVYTISLKSDKAASIFTDRYDTYNLSQYDNYKITANTIIDTYDSKGRFVSEKASFTAGVTYQSENVTVDFSSSVNYLKFDDTSINITDDMKSKQQAYVAYSDIDTDAITSNETASYDDTAESTVTATFKKRLVNRLGYTVSDAGIYQVTYNTNEVYSIDFTNCLFEYSNYSIHYSYSWKNDTGSMAKCTLNFGDDTTSSSCEDSTVDQIRKVKTYLEMELYYCGLSLEDLQKEATEGK